VAEGAVEPVVGVLAHRAGVEQDQVGVELVGGAAVAERLEQPAARPESCSFIWHPKVRMSCSTALQRLRRALDDGQRGAQLVRDRAEEGGLDEVDPAQLLGAGVLELGGLPQLLFGPTSFGDVLDGPEHPRRPTVDDHGVATLPDDGLTAVGAHDAVLRLEGGAPIDRVAELRLVPVPVLGSDQRQQLLERERFTHGGAEDLAQSGGEVADVLVHLPVPDPDAGHPLRFGQQVGLVGELHEPLDPVGDVPSAAVHDPRVAVEGGRPAQPASGLVVAAREPVLEVDDDLATQHPIGPGRQGALSVLTLEEVRERSPDQLVRAPPEHAFPRRVDREELPLGADGAQQIRGDPREVRQQLGVAIAVGRRTSSPTCSPAAQPQAPPMARINVPSMPRRRADVGRSTNEDRRFACAGWTERTR
jgi:hypothetical protein